MRWIDNFRTYRFYRRFYLSFILTVLSTILLLTIMLFGLFTRSSLQSLGQVAVDSLSQTAYAATALQDEMRVIGSQLVQDPAITSLVYTPHDDPLIKYHASQVLRRMQATHPHLAWVAVYNARNDVLLDTFGFSSAQTDELKQMGRAAADGRREGLMPWSFVDPFRRVTRKDLVYCMDSTLYARSGEGFILLGIESRSLMDMVRQISRQTGNETMVLDGTGMVLAHSRQEEVFTQAADKAWLERAWISGTGFHTARIGSQVSLVTAVRTQTGNLTVVNVQPVGQVLVGLRSLTWQVGMAVAVLVIVSLVIVFLVSSRVYNPINLLLRHAGFKPSGTRQEDEITFLTGLLEAGGTMDRVARSRLLHQEATLLTLFVDPAVTPGRDLLHQAGIAGDAKGYVVVLLSIDGAAAFLDGETAEDRALIRFALANVARELFGRAGAVHAVNLDEGLLGLLMTLDSVTLPDMLPLCHAELLQTMVEQFGYSVSTSVGWVVPDPAGIRDSHQSARRGLRRRFALGAGMYTVSDALEEAASERAWDVPEWNSAQIWRGLLHGDRERVGQEVGPFLAALGSAQPEMALLQAQRSLLTVMQSFVQRLTEEENGSIERIHAMINRLHAVETMQGLEKEICFILEAIEKAIPAKEERTDHTAVEDALDYIREHYQDNQLSLESAAARADLSSAYFGRLFRTAMKVSFSEYLNQYRLDRAREAIVADEAPFAEIAGRVGFTNPTYFYTLFKKHVGCTPLQYRMRARQEAER